MPSADQVPIESPHSRMHQGKWVVLIAGPTGSALRAVGPPNLHITSDVRRDPLCRKRDRFLVALALGHHRPGYPRNLIGERNGSDLGGAPRQQRREPGPMLGAMDFGITDATCINPVNLKD